MNVKPGRVVGIKRNDGQILNGLVEIGIDVNVARQEVKRSQGQIQHEKDYVQRNGRYGELSVLGRDGRAAVDVDSFSRSIDGHNDERGEHDHKRERVYGRIEQIHPVDQITIGQSASKRHCSCVRIWVRRDDLEQLKRPSHEHVVQKVKRNYKHQHANLKFSLKNEHKSFGIRHANVTFDRNSH